MKTMNKIQRLSVILMMMLMATATWAYTVTWTNLSGNPAISAIFGSTTIVSGTTPVTAGQTVTLTVAKDDNKYLTGLTVQSDVPATEASAPRRSSPSIAIEGDVEVRQTGEFTYEFTMPIGNVTITPTFANRTSISSANVTLRDAANTTTTSNTGTITWGFDWLPHLPEVYQVEVSSEVLTAGTDYTVSDFTSVTNVEASARTITITGKGKYNGTKNVYYNITPRSISGENGATVELSSSKKSFVYQRDNNGEVVQKPALADISGVFFNGQRLTQGTDYSTEVTYSTTDSKTPGNYTISVTGTGNFKDNASATYTITTRPISDLTITPSATSLMYTGDVQKPTVTVTYENYTLNSTDYTVTYQNESSKDVGIYTMTLNGLENYGGTYTITYTITTGNTITIDDISDQTYTGSDITPDITVKDGTTTLTKGTHYSTVWSNNVNAGSNATVTAVGISSSGYNFIVPKTFKINPKSISYATVALGAGDLTYNGELQQPAVTVTDDDSTPLTVNKDYTLSDGNINAGSGYTVTVTGKGNYTGTKTSTTTYTIQKVTIDANNSSVTLATNNLVYNRTEQTPPAVEKVFVNGRLLTVNTDYTVGEVADKTNAGTKTITITGAGTNYQGSTTTTYTIAPKPLTDGMVELADPSKTYTGSPLTTTVTVKDGETILIGGANKDYEVSYSDNTNVGTAVVTVTGKGNYTGVVKKTFRIVEKTAEGTFTVALKTPSETFTYNGNPHTPEVKVTKTGVSPEVVLTLDTDYSVAWTNNTNAGTATIIVTGKGNYSGTATTTFTIGQKAIVEGNITLSQDSYPYDGSDHKPTVTVNITLTGTTSTLLKENTDYTLTLPGDMRNQGSKTITITGIGNYTGTPTKTYTINRLSIADATVILSQNSFVYSGAAQKPSVEMVYVDGHLLTASTDYSVTPPADDAAIAHGDKTITLTGQGNYTGTKNVTYSITQKPLAPDMIKFDKENFTFDNTLQKPTVTISDKLGANEIITTGDYTVTNDGGTAVGVYYVYVNATTAGNYKGSASRQFNIITEGAGSFTVADIPNVTYDGTTQTPAPVVTRNGTTTPLTLNTDYTVSYVNNKNAGTATVIVTGMGSYAGTITKTFRINPKSLTAAMIQLSSNTFTYNGVNQKPGVTVSDGALMTTDDYTITNNGGTNAGDYYVNVTGRGNYTGTIGNVDETKYTISPLNINSDETTVTLYQLQSYVYDGTQKKPSVREVFVGNVVVPSTDYTTSYGTNTDAGTGAASVTVSGQNNFTGSKTVTFDIEQKTITTSMIQLSNEEYIYTGALQKPEVTVKDGSFTLETGTDYTLTNDGGFYVGTYEISVVGKGNYKGTVKASYTIVAQAAGDFNVTLSTESVVYNGSEQRPTVVVKKGEITLTEDTDYTVLYIDNVNVGQATVTVRGKGNYDGVMNKTFFITPKTLTDAMVTLSASSFTYNSMLQRPSVTVSDATFLTSNDFIVTNEGGQNIGTYELTVTGKNNYTGTVTKQFSITPLSLASANVVLYEMQSYVYDGTAKNPGVREVAVGTLVVPTSGYATSMSPNINVGTVTVTVTGKNNFTGSASTTFNITPKPVSSSMITLTPIIFYYNGSLQKPAVTVKDGTKTMVEDRDYTLINNGGTDSGEYEVKVAGIGNYTDEASVNFSILTSEVNTFDITLAVTTLIYNGIAQQPSVTVKERGRTLIVNQDYTVDYANNVNAGTATVAVTGKGDYKGVELRTFTIQPKTLTDAMVTLDRTSFIYNEKVQKPEVTVSDGTIMTPDDYEVTNDGGTTEGTYQVVVTGQNNYKGVVIKSFTITREDIHGDDDPEHPDEKPMTYTPTEEDSDEVKVSGYEGTETELEQITSVSIPATCTANGKTYSVVGVSANAFANVPNLTDIYLPDTEEPLEIAEDAIPTSVTVHTTLALLDDYALMPSLSENFKAGKIKATVTAKNRYWTFSSGVDVYVPDGVSVYIVHERNNAAVTIVELSDNDLTVGGQRIIKHNNGVLIGSDGNETPYDLVACGRRMSSGSSISTDDFKDYGSQNCLVPVIVPTHFDKGYYFLRNNEFYSIQEEGEDVKVPAGKAVLYLHQAASSPSYSSVIQLVNMGDVTHINDVERDADEGDWYDMSGRKLNGRPTKKGVYIQNNKKIVIR